MIAHINIHEKSFGDLRLYTDLEFRIQAGEKVGLLGRNGTGKSTLFNMISGVDDHFDGDITLVDLAEERTITEDKLLTKVKWSPYTGATLKGWPVFTIVNGEVVYEGGQVNTDIRGKEIQIKPDWEK